MKKFMMIILAVALVTSVASAATIEVAGNTGGAGNTMPGDTLTMTWSDNAEIFGGFSDMNLNVSQGTFVSGAFTSAFAWTIKGDVIPVVSGTGFNVFLAASGFPIPANTGALFTMVFTVPAGAAAGSKVNIAVTDGGFNEMFGGDLPSASLNVVPEPVTLVLLGLGGLFLRRRK